MIAGLILAASAFSTAVPNCGSGRDGSYVITEGIAAEKRLSEMIVEYAKGLNGRAPLCTDGQFRDERGEIVLSLRYTGCYPGTIWFCPTGVKGIDQIPDDLSKIVCRLPKQYDTCTLY